MNALLTTLWIKAQPLILAWAAALLRQYVGFGKKLWGEFNTEIKRLDDDKALTPDSRHLAAVEWLRIKLALPQGQRMPLFCLRKDWEDRAIQLAVLIRRLQTWLTPETVEAYAARR
jgi:hypothetical protein